MTGAITGGGIYTVILTMDPGGNDVAFGSKEATEHSPQLQVQYVAAPRTPTADAGADRAYNDSDNDGQHLVSLDGSGSHDPDGGSIVSYDWYEDGVLLTSGINPTLSIDVGVHTLTLTVTDDEGDSADDTVEITLTPFVSMLPTADAGSNQTINDSDNDGRQSVVLDGGGSHDPDGGSIVSYDWYEDGVLLTSGINPTLSLPVGIHTLMLSVTDDEGDRANDTVDIEISAFVPQAPVADAGPDQTVNDTDNDGYGLVVLSGSGSTDPDGGSIVSYRWYETGELLATGREPSLQLAVGPHILTLTVTDDEGDSSSDAVNIDVFPDADAGRYQTINGEVVIEAEKYLRTNGMLGTWNIHSAITGFQGTGYMVPQAQDAFQTFNVDLCKLEYAIYFNEPGTYFVHLRTLAQTSEGGGFFATLDGAEIVYGGTHPDTGVTASYIYTKPVENWGTWSWYTDGGGSEGRGLNVAVRIKSAGLHYFALFRKDTTTRIDRIWLTKHQRDPLDSENLILPSCLTFLAPSPAAEIPDDYEVTPTVATAWQSMQIEFEGPLHSEFDRGPNPFLDYRLDVVFNGPGGQSFVVPGFFAGDGKGGYIGNKWQVRFTPDESGVWSFSVVFRIGDQAAVGGQSDESAGYPDGVTGTFTVEPRQPDAPGFLSKGRLVKTADNTFYFKTLGDDQYWLTGGTNTPENFLGYDGFFATNEDPGFIDRFHYYSSHRSDWNPGDPNWAKGEDADAGKNIIGMINYLADKNVNSLYLAVMNIGGDGQDVWPYSGTLHRAGNNGADNLNFNLTKLTQWRTVLEHMQKKGILCHILLAESERANKLELDHATLGVERKLLYRELVARFGDLNAITWTMCEEYAIHLALSPATIIEWATYLKQIDPYDHPIGVHGNRLEDYEAFYGEDSIDYFSYQRQQGLEIDPGGRAQDLRAGSEAAGKPVAVSIDEYLFILPEDTEYFEWMDMGSWFKPLAGSVYARKKMIWPGYLSGGHLDFILQEFRSLMTLSTDNFKKYESLWDYLWHARRFVEENLPYWQMIPRDDLIHSYNGQADVLAKSGECYAVYLPRANDGQPAIDLSEVQGHFSLRWYNPRIGAFVGIPEIITAGDIVSLNQPPNDEGEDWAILIQSFDASGDVAPIAYAGGDVYLTDEFANGVERVELDGSGSFDPDGGQGSYQWHKDGIVFSTSAAPTIYLGIGDHNISLTYTDDEGNVSVDHMTARILQASSYEQFVFLPIDDAYLEGRTGVNNDQLRIRDFDSVAYLKFNVSGIDDAVVSRAFLRLHVVQGDGAGRIEAYLGEDQSWSEDNLSFGQGPLLGRKVAEYDGDVQVGSTVEIDLTTAVTRDGLLSLILKKQGGNNVIFGSKESAGFKPVLIVEVVETSPSQAEYLAPVADAGVDQVQNDIDNDGSHIIELDGSASMDPDGGRIDVYRWSHNGHVLASGENATVALEVGVHMLTLTVIDDEGDSASDTVTIDITPAELHPPTSDAGDDQTVNDNDNDGVHAVTLDGSGSTDPDGGGIVSYAWYEEGVQLGSGMTPTLSLAVGTHTLTLTVTDDEGDSSDDTVEIVVTAFVPMAPLADAGADQAVNDSDNDGIHTVTLDGSGSTDPDGGSIVSYAWYEDGVPLAGGMNPTISLSVGVHLLTLTVTDEEGDSDSDSVDIEITPFVSILPTADAGPDQTIDDVDNLGSQPVTLDGSGSTDPDGGSIVSYAWHEDGVLMASGMNPTLAFTIGVHTVTLTVVDDEGDVGTDTLVVEVIKTASEIQTLLASPVDDAYLRNDTRYNEDKLCVKYDQRTSYLRFDVTQIGNGVVSEAVLRLRVKDDPGQGTVRVFLGAHNEWTEETLSVANRPLPGVELDRLTSNFGLDQIIAFDVASAVSSGGIYTFVLMLDDGGNDVAFGSKEAPGYEPLLEVSYEAMDEAPTADAGADQNVVDIDDDGFHTVTLDGSGSNDPDGGSIVSYDWYEEGVQLASGMTPTLSLAVGTHTLTLTVTDDEGDSSDDTVDILLTAFVPMAPVADAGADQTFIDTDNDGIHAVTLDGGGSTDPDGGSIVSYEWYEDGMLLASVMNPTLSLAVGDHTLTLTITDDEGDSASDTVMVRVERPQASQVIHVAPVDDTYLRYTTRMDEDRLRVQSGRRVSYLKFDLTEVDGGQITSVVLRLHVRGDAGNGTLRAHLGEHNNWHEDTLGVSTRPAQGQLLGSITSSYDIDQIVEIDLSNGIVYDGIYTIILTMDVGGNDVAFGSKEAPGFEPQLVVEFAPPASS